MSRRAVLHVAVVLALMGGGLLINRGMGSVAAAGMSLGRTASSAAEGRRAGTARAGRQPVVTETVDGVTDIDPHKAFGSKNAPIVMEVFSDYQCPACRQYFETTNRLLMDNYVSTGKVFLIHRDFPLPMHAYSRIAARYARAAAEIGKIEPVEQALFDNQEKWEQTGDVDGTVAAVLTASEMAKVRALVKGGTLEPLINKDYELGEIYRVNQTPTSVFHYKGQTYPYAGVMNYDVLSQFLNQLLSQR
ncbi:MAG: thioredoxin domain-containing protein [Candidatus Acidiferrum sp.]